MSAKTETIVTPAGRTVVVAEDKGVRTFDFGIIVTNYGVKGDPDRIKTMVGEIPLYPDACIPFAHLDEWPEGIINPAGERKIVVQYLDIDYSNFESRNAKIESDRYPMMGFADLCAVLKTDDLLTELPKILWEHNVYWLEVLDDLSLLKDEDIDTRGHVPRFRCSRRSSDLFTFWIGSERFSSFAELVGEQVS